MPEERLRWQGASGAVEADLGVVIIRAGEANGRRFPAPMLAARAAAFEGAPCFVDHASALDATRPGGRSVRDLAGHIHGARWDAVRGAVVGRLALLSQGQWVAALAREAGERAYLGLSADMWVRQQEQEVTAIDEVCSVDIVISPAAGGRFLATLAQRGKEPMMSMEQTETTRVQTAQAHEPPLPPPSALDEATALRAQLLESKLAAAHLPAALAGAVRAQLEGRAASAAEMDAAIHSQRAALAEAVAQTSIVGLGQVSGIITPLEKITLAFERLMGLPETAAHRDVAPLSGIRELYDLLSGDWERHGVFQRGRVQLANATTSTLSNVVANVLNKVLLRSYEARAAWWKPLAAEYDFSTMNTARFVYLGGFPDLDTVAEGGSYTEKSWSDNAETAAFVKKGNYLGLTLEMLDRDDVNAVRALPRRLAVAAQRTLASAVAALFTASAGVGPILADGKALFHTDHGNLGSTAFSANEWDTVIQAMWKQSELSSAKRLGVRPRWCLVPIELEKDALTVFNSDFLQGAATYSSAPNVRRGSGTVIAVPEWTDANNWAAVADPNDLEGVCIGYRYGRAPELYVADDPLSGSMFTNDELRIKVRFVYAVGVGDYRALYKENVA
jgi:hypothetical protein